MSPLLFAIYVSSLGEELNNSGLGVQLGSVVLSAIFFADDIVLITESEAKMNKLLSIVKKWTLKWRMDISVAKSKVMSMSYKKEKWSIFNTEKHEWDEMEVVNCFKYLGNKIEIAPWRMFREMNQSMTSAAKNYMYHIMSLSKTGPDTSEVARSLWSGCAIPAFLYGCECSHVTETTINELESIQAKVANFILQIPVCSSSTAGIVDVGFKSIRQQIHERKLSYHHRLLSLPAHWWTRIAYSELAKLGMRSVYIPDITRINKEGVQLLEHGERAHAKEGGGKVKAIFDGKMPEKQKVNGFDVSTEHCVPE